MSKVERGTVTIVATGNRTVYLSDFTLVPEYVSLSVTTNNGNERSLGGSNGIINFSGCSGTYTDVSTTKSIMHYRNVSGIKTKTIEGTVTAMGTGYITFNFTTWTENTTLTLTVYGN